MKSKKEKVVLVFDEKDRREFLTGFRKRKNARRKKALEETKKKEEEKRKQVQEEKREALRHHIEEYENKLKNNSEIEEDLVEQPENIIHDFGHQTVTVSAITDEEMGKDCLICAIPTVQSQTQTKNTRLISDSRKQTTKDKLLRKKQFRKKAQKRKIQAISDKKSLKQKLRQKGKRK